MAERRCLARSVVTGDAYLGLSHAARTLYVHLLVTADDDGFTDSVVSAQRLTETGANELEELKNAGFVIIFSSGVAAVRHFWVHNTKRSDRYKPTLHTCEKTQVNKSDNGIYEFADGNQLATNRQPAVVAKERKERKERKENNLSPSNEVEERAQDDEDFERFWVEYPRKTCKNEARKMFRKINPDVALLGQMMLSLKQQKKGKQWQDEKFIPYPANWLKDRRWEDEAATTTNIFDNIGGVIL